MLSFDLESINAFVLRKQHLSLDTTCRDIPTIVEGISGLHATSPTTPYLSLFARHPDFERTLLESELYEKKSMAKIRCVRKTIYIHTKKLLPIVHAATAASVIKASRKFMQARGVSENEYDQISKDILELLSQEKMTASAIKDTLHSSQDVSSILYFMCDQGILLRAKPSKSWRDKNHQYERFCDAFPDLNLKQYSEKEAISLLIERYIASFGPVTENDILWWTGLGKTKIRQALQNLQGKIRTISITGLEGMHFMLTADLDSLSGFTAHRESTINLLPHLDPYLMGYKDRGRHLNPRDTTKVFDRSGNATSTILLNGKVVGLWDFERGDTPTIKLLHLRQLTAAIKKAIRKEALRLGVFMAEEEVKIIQRDRMTPLTDRTAGGFMTPLRD
jgi:hypothetical protein